MNSKGRLDGFVSVELGSDNKLSVKLRKRQRNNCVFCYPSLLLTVKNFLTQWTKLTQEICNNT
jgi:hypothetical protein